MIYLWWETERENWSWSLLGVKGLNWILSAAIDKGTVYWLQWEVIAAHVSSVSSHSSMPKKALYYAVGLGGLGQGRAGQGRAGASGTDVLWMQTLDEGLSNAWSIADTNVAEL